jgi:hypothetical protein
MNNFFVSDYSHQFYIVRGRNILAIIDLDKGRTSVTNNIENVLKQIQLQSGLTDEEFKKVLVIYRDSQGDWDGFDHNRELGNLGSHFIFLGSEDMEVAINKYLDKIEKEAKC